MDKLRPDVDRVNTIRINADMVKRTPIPNEVTRFQKRWPSFEDFASDAGVTYGAAQQMRRRNSITPAYFTAIAEGAARRGIGAKTKILNELLTMKSKKKVGA